MAKSTHKKSSQKRTMRSKHTKRQTKKVRRNRKKTKKSNLKGGNNNFYPLAQPPRNLNRRSPNRKNFSRQVIRRPKKPKSPRYNITNQSPLENVTNGTTMKNYPRNN